MCGRGAAAAASEKLAKKKRTWSDIAREIAVEFRANPKKYGDGSGSLRSWVIGSGSLHPSGFPESSLTTLQIACRTLTQLLVANDLDDTAPAGHTAQGGPSSPEDEEPQVTGGLTPHPDSPLKDMASVVKDDDYRACWKFCLAEMRAELSGRKRCRDGYGPTQIRKRALVKYTRAPSVKTLQNAMKNSIESPPKVGRTCDMPEGVSVWLEEILKGFRKHKFMMPKTSIIENAKLLITGTV